MVNSHEFINKMGEENESQDRVMPLHTNFKKKKRTSTTAKIDSLDPEEISEWHNAIIDLLKIYYDNSKEEVHYNRLTDKLDKLMNEKYLAIAVCRNITDNKTLLMHMIEKDFTFGIEKFSKYDNNFRNINEQTVLIYAATLGKAKYVEILYEAGLKSELKDNQGETAFIVAARNGDIDFLNNMAKNYSTAISEQEKQQALIVAAKEKKYQVINYLVRDINFIYSMDNIEKLLSTMNFIFNENILEYSIEKEKIFNLLDMATKFTKEIRVFNTLLKQIDVDFFEKSEFTRLYNVAKYYITKVEDLEKVEEEIFSKLLKIVEIHVNEHKKFDSKFFKVIIKANRLCLFEVGIKSMINNRSYLENILELIGDNDSNFLRVFINIVSISPMMLEEMNSLIVKKLSTHLVNAKIFNDETTINNIYQIIRNFIEADNNLDGTEEKKELYNKLLKFSVDHKKENLLEMITKKHSSMLSKELFNLITLNNLANPIIKNIDVSLIDEKLFVSMQSMIEEYLKSTDVNKVDKEITDKLYNIIEKNKRFIKQGKLTEESVKKLVYLSIFHGNKKLFGIMKTSNEMKRSGLMLANENKNGILDSLILNNVHTHLNEKGQNALMEAAEKGLRNLVTKLLPKTSNKLLKDKSGCNVFDLAIINGRYEVVDTLISSKEMEKYFVFQKDFWFKNRWKTSIINRLLGTGTIVENLEMRNLMYKLKMNSDIDNDSKNGILNLVNTSFGVNIDQNFFDNDQSRVNHPHDQSKKVAEETANFYKENLSRITTNDLVTTASEDSIITPRYSSPMASNSQLKVDSVIQRTSKLTLA